MTSRLEEYRDKQGDWRWRVVSKGRILADSSEGYRRRIDMRKAVISTERALLHYMLKPIAETMVSDIQKRKK